MIARIGCRWRRRWSGACAVGILFLVPAIFGGIFAYHDHLDALNPSLLGSIVIVE